jgi:hypothetical protein
VPIEGLSVHVTEVLVEPVTLAVNCRVCELDKVAEVGLTPTATGGTRLIIALADLVESAALVAVMVTLWAVLMLAGAVYRPLPDNVPTAGLKLQVAAVLVLPVTLAVNCFVCDAVKLAVSGVIPTLTAAAGVTDTEPAVLEITPPSPSFSASTGFDS